MTRRKQAMPLYASPLQDFHKQDPSRGPPESRYLSIGANPLRLMSSLALVLAHQLGETHFSVTSSWQFADHNFFSYSQSGEQGTLTMVKFFTSVKVNLFLFWQLEEISPLTNALLHTVILFTLTCREY
jgi:hypothetical protein